MKLFRKQTLSAAAVILSAVAMVGCSDTEQPAAATGTPTGGPIFASQVAAPVAAPAAPVKAPTKAPMAELSAYQPFTSQSLVFAYHARKPGDADLDALARVLSSKYNSESDAFKKRDLLNELTPQVEERLAASKAAPHFEIQSNVIAYEYNFDTQSFQLDQYDDAEVRLRHASPAGYYDLSFNNALEFKNFVVKDQALARTLEERRLKNFRSFKIRTYVTVVGLGQRENEVVASISKVQILDENGAVLAEN